MQSEQHAYARIARASFRPEMLEQALARIRDISTPLVRNQPGSLGILTAANRENGDTYAISFWQTRGDLERSHTNPPVVEALVGYAEWMTGPFTVASYDIVGGALPVPDLDAGAGRWLRMTSIVAREDAVAGVIAAMRDRLLHLTADVAACTNALLLVPHTGLGLVAFEFWSSLSALATFEADALFQHPRRPWRTGALESPPRREVLEIIGYD